MDMGYRLNAQHTFAKTVGGTNSDTVGVISRISTTGDVFRWYFSYSPHLLRRVQAVSMSMSIGLVMVYVLYE